MNLIATVVVCALALSVLVFSTGSWLNDEVIDWKMIMVVSLSIAVFEEFCFRGIVFTSLIENSGSLVKASLISSAAFGAIHLLNLRGEVITQDAIVSAVSQVLFAFSMGVLFCGIYAKTGWLFSGIFLHFAWDVVNLSKSKIKLEAVDTATQAADGNPVHSAIFGLFVLGLICGVGILLLNSAKRTQSFSSNSI